MLRIPDFMNSDDYLQNPVLQLLKNMQIVQKKMRKKQ